MSVYYCIIFIKQNYILIEILFTLHLLNSVYENMKLHKDPESNNHVCDNYRQLHFNIQ